MGTKQIDFDPFAQITDKKLIPVDGDPFASSGDKVAPYGLSGLVTGDKGPELTPRQQEYQGRSLLGQLPMAIEDMTGLGINGLTLGQAPKIKAFIQSQIQGKPYEELRQQYQGQMDEYKANAGLPGIGIESLGLGKTAIAAAGRGVTAAGASIPFVGKIGQGLGNIIDNAALGGIYSSGQGQDAFQGAGLGALFGAAGNLVGKTVGKTADWLKGKPELKSGDNLFEDATKQYQVAENSGLKYSPEAFTNMINDSLDVGSKHGIGGSIASLADKVYPKAAPFLNELEKLKGSSPGLMDVVKLKRLAAAGGKGIDADAALMREIAGTTKGNISNSATGDFVSGQANTGIAALKKADDLWGKALKTQKVENILEGAKDTAGANYTQAGKLTAARQAFKTIKANPSKFKRDWTKEEQQAITKIVRGSSGENVARLFGKMAVRGPVSGLATFGGLGGILGAPYAVGGAIAGEAGKAISTRMGLKSIDALQEIIQNGKLSQSLSPSQREAINSLVRALAQGGAVAATRNLATENSRP